VGIAGRWLLFIFLQSIPAENETDSRIMCFLTCRWMGSYATCFLRIVVMGMEVTRTTWQDPLEEGKTIQVLGWL
jgi:hypothetical protein